MEKLEAEHEQFARLDHDALAAFKKVQSRAEASGFSAVLTYRDKADKFLDDAVMAGMAQVLVIHGKGTGVLRKNIQAYLQQHRSVLNFHFADAGEGGTGATIVDLK